jgi:hypothetical protein
LHELKEKSFEEEEGLPYFRPQGLEANQWENGKKEI